MLADNLEHVGINEDLIRWLLNGFANTYITGLEIPGGFPELVIFIFPRIAIGLFKRR